MTREINITPVLNGYVCRVGCQTVVFESRLQLLKELDAYLSSPEETEKRFVTNAINKMDRPECPPAQACPPPQSYGAQVENTIASVAGRPLSNRVEERLR